MSKSIYLINPRAQNPSYFGAEVYAGWGFAPVQGIADLSVTTVAALVPEDFELALCDEYITPVDFDSGADFIGITGKITQAGRMTAIADEFRRRGKVILIGGPYASLSPEAVRDHCDILVKGELEGVADELFSDLRGGSWRDEYTGDRPELTSSPVPRWDLYPNDRALLGCVQTSRGCPFECEFCDVIQYLGRKQRHKSIPQILAELDHLYGYGYRTVFLADDNFTVYRRRAKEVLAALKEWNDRPEPVRFGTQLSIDATKDEEILRLCAEAGMTWVFIGIETPNEESLRETHKRQNVGVDLTRQIQRFLEYGISVTAGMIVGFDADKLDIFQRQYDFAMSTPVPIFTLGALVAPAATPLYDRMQRSGRLLTDGSEVAADPWDTNIVPTGMTRSQLLDGLRWLCNSLYSPENFTTRLLDLVHQLGPLRGPRGLSEAHAPPANRRTRRGDELNLLRKLIKLGPREKRMWSRVSAAMADKPEAGVFVLENLFKYAQIRHMYEAGRFWEPQVAEAPFGADTASAAAWEASPSQGSSHPSPAP